MRNTAASRWADWVPPSNRPQIEPLFGPKPGWEPSRPCPHCGHMPRHTRMVCMVCHQTGERMERIAARDDLGPRPEEKPKEKKPKSYAGRRYGNRAADAA